MRKLVIAILLIAVAISASAAMSAGWKNITTGSDSLLGAADTVDTWLRYSAYRNYYDKWVTLGAEYTIIGGDSANIALTILGYVKDDNVLSCTWDATLTDDSTFTTNLWGIDSLDVMIMFCDSILIRAISTAEASDSLALELYLGYATFNQDRW